MTQRSTENKRWLPSVHPSVYSAIGGVSPESTFFWKHKAGTTQGRGDKGRGGSIKLILETSCSNVAQTYPVLTFILYWFVTVCLVNRQIPQRCSPLNTVTVKVHVLQPITAYESYSLGSEDRWGASSLQDWTPLPPIRIQSQQLSIQWNNRKNGFKFLDPLKYKRLPSPSAIPHIIISLRNNSV